MKPTVNYENLPELKLFSENVLKSCKEEKKTCFVSMVKCIVFIVAILCVVFKFDDVVQSELIYYSVCAPLLFLAAFFASDFINFFLIIKEINKKITHAQSLLKYITEREKQEMGLTK